MQMINKMVLSPKNVIQNDLDDDCKLALQLQLEEQNKVDFKNRQMQQQLEEETKSLNFIQKMNYQQHKKEVPLSVKNVQEGEEAKEFICKICLETLVDKEVIPLSSCEHVFHAECINLFIQSQVDV